MGDSPQRSRSARRTISEQDHCWVKVKNGQAAIMISLKDIDEPRNVFNLIKWVKANKNSLKTVDLDDLQLFQSKNAMNEALQPDTMVKEALNISGGTANNPFFLSFPDSSLEATPSQVAALLMRIEAKVDAHGAKVDAHGAKVDAVATLQINMVTVSPVTESAAATQTRGRDWHIKVVNYYDCQQCMVLSQLYPDERRLPDWFSKDDHFRKACSPFPAVAEHIIPKGQEIVGKSWDVDIHDGCNGLLLLRHLERMYQVGKWSMLPVTEGTEAGMFQIYVADDCHEERIMYYPEFGEARHRVKVSDRPLTLADLHGKRIELIGKYQANPSLRALFLKAMMAHKVHQSLPDPETRLQSYAMKCQKMSMPNWHIWRTSVPDPGLPVVQTVPHEHED